MESASTGPSELRAARVVVTTCPDPESAQTLGRALVEARLVACAQISPGVVSVYRWKGAVERADEVLLCLKTVAGRVREVEAYLARHHPYEVPEVLVLSPERVAASYAAWLVAETSSEGP